MVHKSTLNVSGGSGSGLSSLNSLTGAVNLISNSNTITITKIGNNIDLEATGGGSGSVTQVNTGTGLSGGPITTTGTISVANSTSNTLAGYNASGVFSDVAIGSGLSLSSGTLTSISTGAVSSVSNSDGTLNISPTTGAVIASLQALNSANILVGNASNTAKPVSVSGDISLANTGAFTLATVNSTTGTFTNTTLTVNAKGLITAASSGSAGGVTSFSGDGVLFNNTSSTGTVTASLAVATANSVWGNNTTSAAPPFYATSISITGTIASAANAITSASATALLVGPNGGVNPTFTVNASTASAATGLSVIGAAAGSNVNLGVLSSAANEGITITPKGTGGANSIGVVFANNFSTAINTTVKFQGNSATIPSGYIITVNGNYINSAGGYFSNGWKYDQTGPGLAQMQCAVGTTSAVLPEIFFNFAPVGGTANAAATLSTTVAASTNSFLLTPTTLSTANIVRFGHTGAADTALTAGTEAPNIYFNMSQTRQHATGALALQRDFRVTGSTHSFVAASTLTQAAALSIDGAPIGGTNATITSSAGIYIPTIALTNVTNGYGIQVAAPTGAGTLNQAALFTGDVGYTSGNILINTAGNGLQIKGGSNARIGTGALVGGTLTVANTSVTANSRVFLQDTNTSLTNVGTLTVVTTAGTGFVVTSTSPLDTSTFNWIIFEQN